jgi:hypothetical protein
MALYDPYYIEERLKEYDPNIRRIDFDPRRGLHRIVCWDPYVEEEYIAMTCKAGELDARVYNRMREINPSHFNALEEIQRAQAEKEREEERKINHMAQDWADNIQSAFSMKPSRSID